MERLKLLRKEKNITQGELAKRMRVNEKTISRWEKGISEVSKGQLNLLADILDTWDGYLLGYSDERYMPMEEYMKRAKHDKAVLDKKISPFIVDYSMLANLIYDKTDLKEDIQIFVDVYDAISAENKKIFFLNALNLSSAENLEELSKIANEIKSIDYQEKLNREEFILSLRGDSTNPPR